MHGSPTGNVTGMSSERLMSAGPTPSRPALYVRATRPLYLPTSVLPAAAGALVAIGVPGAAWWAMPLALVALLLVHAGTNVVNDVEDFAHGVDGPEKMDNSRVFTTGLLSVREGRALGLVCFAGAAVIGVGIALVQGPAVLAYGAVGALGGYLYTGGPRPYKHLGLGDPLIILLMGPLMTQGAYSAVTGEWFSAPAFWCGLFPGLLIAAVLQGNNASDISADRDAGIRTIAVRVGFRRARALYLASLGLADLTIPLLWVAGLFDAWILVALVTAPLAAARARQALAARGEGDPALLTLAPGTAQLHLPASASLVAAVILARSL
jgi:1,4-dihydroxy-2-naphthoate octaprenyltransferase